MDEKTILIVDDTVENLDILAEILQDYDVIDAINGKMALEIVHEEKVDLILLDIMMPEMDGYEVCQRLKSDPVSKDIPIIFLTAKTDEASIEKAYDVGGGDYVTKPFLPKELLSRVKKELQIQQMMQELKRLAATDPLTRLYNRRHFDENTQPLYQLARREGKPLSLIMLDIDKFKSINDNYGHYIGDQVIIHLAETIKQNQRKSDLSARFGGEEFVMLLPNTDLQGANVLAEKLRKNVQDAVLEISRRQILQYTISLGVAEINVSRGESIVEGIKKADVALYEAKEGGRNQTAIYTSSGE